MNRVVVHFQDGHLLKGLTNDFLPAKDHFHLQQDGAGADTRPVDVKVAELKALFFVKDYAGHSEHKRVQEFDPAHHEPGRRIRVVFKDGEVMIGTTQGYQPGRPGFFVTPADSGGNNERCFVVTSATKEVAFIQ